MLREHRAGPPSLACGEIVTYVQPSYVSAFVSAAPLLLTWSDPGCCALKRDARRGHCPECPDLYGSHRCLLEASAMGGSDLSFEGNAGGRYAVGSCREGQSCQLVEPPYLYRAFDYNRTAVPSPLGARFSVVASVEYDLVVPSPMATFTCKRALPARRMHSFNYRRHIAQCRGVRIGHRCLRRRWPMGESSSLFEGEADRWNS